MARIGFVTPWFPRGIAYVTKTFARALTELGHEPFYFIRAGGVYGQEMRGTEGEWALPNRTDYPSVQVNPSDLSSWARYHGLDAVVFNEEYQSELPMAVQQAGIKTIEYVDAYLAQRIRPLLKFRDQLWCVTHRSEAILHEWRKQEQTHYVGWGVPSEFIGVHAEEAPRVDFMSSQGWIGIDARKGLDTLLAALALMDDDPPEVLIHCQLPEEAAKQVIGWSGGLPPHVIWEDADVPPPGLYHLGRVVVQPSKLEGFGLSLVEAMCAGRPVITVDAPPMHEFVTPACGWLVAPDAWKPHPDGSVYQQALIRPEVLAKVLQEARAASDELISEQARLTLTRAKDIFDWETFKARLAVGLERLGVP